MRKGGIKVKYKKYKLKSSGETFEAQIYPFIKDTLYFSGNFYKNTLRTVKYSYIKDHPELFEKCAKEVLGC